MDPLITASGKQTVKTDKYLDTKALYPTEEKHPACAELRKPPIFFIEKFESGALYNDTPYTY